jgi:hypothetical protein
VLEQTGVASGIKVRGRSGLDRTCEICPRGGFRRYLGWLVRSLIWWSLGSERATLSSAQTSRQPGVHLDGGEPSPRSGSFGSAVRSRGVGSTFKKRCGWCHDNPQALIEALGHKERTAVGVLSCPGGCKTIYIRHIRHPAVGQRRPGQTTCIW